MSTIFVDDIIDLALRQPEKERARIAEIMISSLEDSVDKNIELAWQEEVTRRLKEIDSGAATCIPWEEVRDKLRRNTSAEN